MTASSIRLRSATAADAVACSDIERQASLLFKDTSFAWLAGDAATPDVYARAAANDGLLVAEDDGRETVAFVMTRPLGPEALYVAELAVAPQAQGRRLGARLLDGAGTRAAEDGRRWLVLRTFAAVTWNAPYYRRLGFIDPPPGLSDATLDAMARIAAEEAQWGLPAGERVFLARRLGG